MWRKEEERLQADQSRLDKLKFMLDDPNAAAATSTPVALSPAYEAELKRKEEEVRLREERLVEHAAKLEAVAARLQRLPDIDSLLKALEGFRGDPSALLGLANNNAGGAGRKTAEAYKAEIAELQQVLMDEKKTPKEIDDANIKLEVHLHITTCIFPLPPPCSLSALLTQCACRS